jgi:polyisoprenoid-binding protein YceI
MRLPECGKEPLGYPHSLSPETHLFRLEREFMRLTDDTQSRADQVPAYGASQRCAMCRRGSGTRSLLAVSLAAVLLAACAAPSERPSPAANPGAATVASAPALPGSALWKISAAESLITIEVLRGGPMAKLGHNHVIAARGIEGSVVTGEPLENSTFEVRLPVAQFTVDEPQLRAVAGADFAAPVPDSARAGTRANMLGSGLLDAERYPEIRLRSQSLRRAADGYVTEVSVELRGMRRQITLPLSVQREAGGLSVSGEFELRQSELGLTPFSVMMGALQVQDAMHLRFHIVARPPSGS